MDCFIFQDPVTVSSPVSTSPKGVDKIGYNQDPKPVSSPGLTSPKDVDKIRYFKNTIWISNISEVCYLH